MTVVNDHTAYELSDNIEQLGWHFIQCTSGIWVAVSETVCAGVVLGFARTQARAADVRRQTSHWHWVCWTRSQLISHSKLQEKPQLRDPRQILRRCEFYFIISCTCILQVGWYISHRKKAYFDPAGSRNPFTNFDETSHG